MIKTCLKRFGLWPVVVAVTVISIAISLLLAIIVHVFVLGVEMPASAWALSIGCPLLIAPTMSVGSFSLLLKLDLAHEQLRIISDTDYLTGAYNRRYFMSRLTEEVERCLRAGRPFSVALMDVDNFKSVNDTHGHSAGDEVLRCMAQTCMAQLRHIDTFARVGGEEFAVLLPNTDGEQAMQWVERLREQIAQLQIELPAANLGVTVSIGLVSAGRPPLVGVSEINAVLRVADEALYRAKREGKNRVAVPA
ncbi:MAG: GGDEF domain-containing protein [Betaproteobacteria bacterium]|nr:MAG: GGDEF domain-containing protein [Betaproteobacteria bacterium]